MVCLCAELQIFSIKHCPFLPTHIVYLFSPWVSLELLCCTQGLASPSASGLPPESGTETHFNRQALNFDRGTARPATVGGPVPSLGCWGSQVCCCAFPALHQGFVSKCACTCECHASGASPLAPACWAAHVKPVLSCWAGSSFYKMSRCAGAIPFLALSPPVAAALPLLPVDLVAYAGTLQACAVSLLT